MNSQKHGSARLVPSGEYSTVAREREDGSFEFVVEEVQGEVPEVGPLAHVSSPLEAAPENPKRRALLLAALALASIATVWAAGLALTAGSRVRTDPGAQDADASSSGFTPYDGSAVPLEKPKKYRSLLKEAKALREDQNLPTNEQDAPVAPEAEGAEITESEEIPTELLEEEERARAATNPPGDNEPTPMQREMMRKFQRSRTKGVRVDDTSSTFHDLRTRMSPQLNSKVLKQMELRMELPSGEEDNVDKVVDEQSEE